MRKSSYVSALELFSVGIGPSSSHTVGPMRAARRFREELSEISPLDLVSRYECTLCGSLASTGIGHGTPDAVIAGLRGKQPETVDPEDVWGVWDHVQSGGVVMANQVQMSRRDFVFAPFERPHGHPNSMRLNAWVGNEIVLTKTYLSVGGGFIVEAGETPVSDTSTTIVSAKGYQTAQDLLNVAGDGTIAQVARDHEHELIGELSLMHGLRRIREEMVASIERGLSKTGELPGSLRVPRRAAAAWRSLSQRDSHPWQAPEAPAIFAMAVNEENAAGQRVVTAPTNGAAGVLPAVLHYATLEHRLSDTQVEDFLLTASAIGSIIKANASISGAEAGCQAEIGSACAMAAAGFTAVCGGSPRQVQNAAEIAIEHHLGLTCDPVGGLVQIPCIERNAVAAGTALTAARLAMLGDGSHIVALDTVIETMKQTGADMLSKYKETSQGGLAVNVVEC